MEEEIDLRPYIRALFRAWYWIMGAAVLAAVTAFLVSSRLPETYEAEAVVAIVRERTDVSFNTSIETQEDILGSRDVRSRLDALVGLVKSGDVAAQVLAEVSTELKAENRSVPSLLDMVEASNAGDLILIKVRHNDPALAARIANVWAQAYERHVNTLYVSGTSINRDTVAAQTAAASTEYESAQVDLEAFIGDNRITLLENEIAAQEALLASYQTARNTIQSAPIDLQANARRNVLADYYNDLGNIELWLADAQALREQVQEDAGSTAASLGNALALISLRNRVFGGGDETIILQLDLAAPLEPVRLADVDAVIAVLEVRRTETERQIESLSVSFAAVEPEELVITEDNPISQRIADLNENLLKLRAELAAQSSRQEELTRARDLAWDAYQALAKKQKEVAIAADSTGTEVKLASNAAAPGAPVGTGRLLMAIVAGVIGGMLAVFGVTAVYWWRGEEVEKVNRK